MNPMERLTELTDEMVTVDADVALFEKRLKNLQSRQRLLTQELIPEEMRTTGQDLLKLPDGRYLELTDYMTARIPKEAREAAYDYLESVGEGGMIKRMVTCEFRKDQEAEANAALKALHQFGFHHAYVEKTVAWNTFQKWVEDTMETGKRLPRDLLGIHLRTVARIRRV